MISQTNNNNNWKLWKNSWIEKTKQNKINSITTHKVTNEEWKKLQAKYKEYKINEAMLTTDIFSKETLTAQKRNSKIRMQKNGNHSTENFIFPWTTESLFGTWAVHDEIGNVYVYVSERFVLNRHDFCSWKLIYVSYTTR